MRGPIGRCGMRPNRASHGPLARASSSGGTHSSPFPLLSPYNHQTSHGQQVDAKFTPQSPQAGMPARSPSPALPTELLQEVLELTLVGQEPADQQLARNRFRRVSRAWSNSFNYWKEIAVVGPTQISKLTSKLKVLQARAEADPVNGNIAPHLRIKTAFVQTITDDLLLVEGRVDFDCAHVLSTGLLELMPVVKRLTLVRRETLDDRDGDHTVAELTALSKMEHLVSFTYKESDDAHNYPRRDFSDVQLVNYVDHILV